MREKRGTRENLYFFFSLEYPWVYGKTTKYIRERNHEKEDALMGVMLSAQSARP